jgi:hypothetical protein
MGNSVKKSGDDEIKKEYFKIVKNNFDRGLKRINSTIHSDNSEEHWVKYLISKLSDYYNVDKNNKFIQNILYYLSNTNDTEDSKYIYNLNLFLAKQTDEEFLNKLNKSKTN